MTVPFSLVIIRDKISSDGWRVKSTVSSFGLVVIVISCLSAEVPLCGAKAEVTSKDVPFFVMSAMVAIPVNPLAEMVVFVFMSRTVADVS